MYEACDDIDTAAMGHGLLPGVIYYDKIKLLGQWCSDKMMTYINMSNHLLLHKFASVMVDHGN